MDRIEALTKAWDDAHWEFTLAYEGLSDEDLWKRPHPNLLSMGELAAHVGHCESKLALQGIDSPFADEQFGYYKNQVGNPVVLDMTVEQVLAEVKRLQEAAKVTLATVEDFDATVPWRADFTWAYDLEYRGFHVAYHCGQAYSVRHLMGHETTDN